MTRLRFLVLVCAIGLALLPQPGRGQESPAAEHDFLASHGPVTVCVDPDWPPYEIIDAQGRHQGIAADLLKLAAERAGISLRLVPTANWDDSLQASRDGRCDILSFLNKSAARDQWLLFTEPLFIDRNVIVTREEHPFVDDLGAVGPQIMVLPKGTSVAERLRNAYPDLTIEEVDSEAEAFARVSDRRAAMTMRSLIVAVYTIKKDGWFNLKVAGQVPGFDNLLRIGVRKDLPLLRDALDRGVAAVTPAERAEIANRHVAINVQARTDYRLIAKIVGVFLLVVLSNLFWVAKLRRANRELAVRSRTDALTGLANRSAMNEWLDQALRDFDRNRRPVSAILLDMDHFKMANDQFGHAEGDRILQAFAALAHKTLRANDHVARWGGEEFLVLCRDTEASQAVILAERLCDAMRRTDFQTGRRQTVSAGVAALTPGDSVDSLVNRADAALYRAKDAGRDQVCADG